MISSHSLVGSSLSLSAEEQKEFLEFKRQQTVKQDELKAQGMLLTEFAKLHKIELSEELQKFPDLKINGVLSGKDSLIMFLLKEFLTDSLEIEDRILFEKLMEKDSGCRINIKDENGVTPFMYFLANLEPYRYKSEVERINTATSLTGLRYENGKIAEHNVCTYHFIQHLLFQYLADQDLTLKADIEIKGEMYKQITLYDVFFIINKPCGLAFSFGSAKDEETYDPMHKIAASQSVYALKDMLELILNRMSVQIETNPALRAENFFNHEPLKREYCCRHLEEVLTELQQKRNGVTEEQLRKKREERYDEKQKIRQEKEFKENEKQHQWQFIQLLKQTPSHLHKNKDLQSVMESLATRLEQAYRKKDDSYQRTLDEIEQEFSGLKRLESSLIRLG